LKADSQLDAVVSARANHVSRFVDAHRHRFLCQDVLARFGGGDGLGGVNEVWGGDEHGVHVRVSQQIIQRIVGVGNPVLLSERFGAAHISTVCRDDVGVVRDVHGGNDFAIRVISCADYSPSDCHDCFLPRIIVFELIELEAGFTS
jgi:hypothetical protein